MSSTVNPIPNLFTKQDQAFLSMFDQQLQLEQLAREAKEKDDLLQSLRDYAYQVRNFSLATKLERYSHHSHRRLNRRYANLQIH